MPEIVCATLLIFAWTWGELHPIVLEEELPKERKPKSDFVYMEPGEAEWDMLYYTEDSELESQYPERPTCRDN